MFPDFQPYPMKPPFLIIALGIFTVALPNLQVCYGQSASLPVLIGGQEIQLCPPDGFSFVKGVALENVLKQSPDQPAINCFAVCLSHEDLPKALNDKLGTAPRYGYALSIKAIENTTVTDSMFASVKNGIIKKQFLANADQNIKDKVTAFYNKDIKTDTSSLGLLYQGNDYISILSASKISTVENGENKVAVILCTYTSAKIKSRLVNLPLYAKYTDDLDLEWLKNATKQLIDRTMEANK